MRYINILLDSEDCKLNARCRSLAMATHVFVSHALRNPLSYDLKGLCCDAQRGRAGRISQQIRPKSLLAVEVPADL